MSWKKVKLGDVCDFQGGSQPPKSKFVQSQLDGYIRFIQIRDFKTDKKITYIPISNKNRLCNKKDILIGRYGASVGQIHRGLSGAYNVALMKTMPNLNYININWFYYYLNSDQFQRPLANVSSRSAQDGFSKKDITEFELLLPPPEEQKRIVAKLDAVFGEIDKAIKIETKQLDNYDALLSSIIDSECNNSIYKKCNLIDLCEATQGVQISKNEQEKEFSNELIRYLYISDFSHNKNLKFVKNKYPSKIVKESDIIVVNTGASAGNIFKGIHGVLSNNLFKVTPNNNLISSDYLFYFVRSAYFKKYQKDILRGSANPHMGHKNFLSTPIFLPPINNQKNITLKLNKISYEMENKTIQSKQKLNELHQLRSSILTQELKSEAA